MICCFHFGFAQNETSNTCKGKIISYLDDMEKILSPKNNQVYYMKYSTNTVFFEEYKVPTSSTTTEMLISGDKVMMNDENMKIYGNQEEMFVVLPKANIIYWNDSDPRLFSDNNSQKKFLDIERSLLKSSSSITCDTKENQQEIIIFPNKDFEKKTGLLKQVLVYDLESKRVISVENRFNKKSKIKKQVVYYEVVDYNSNNKIKEPLNYVFNGTELKPAYKNFEIINNRKNK
ncbi:hypothetical protein GCM10022258_13720 [Aquimarina gracilis]